MFGKAKVQNSNVQKRVNLEFQFLILMARQYGATNREALLKNTCSLLFKALIFNPNSHRITPYHASPRGQEFKSHYLRKSRIARHSSKNRIFFYFAKTSLLVTLFKEKQFWVQTIHFKGEIRKSLKNRFYARFSHKTRQDAMATSREG